MCVRCVRCEGGEACTRAHSSRRHTRAAQPRDSPLERRAGVRVEDDEVHLEEANRRRASVAKGTDIDMHASDGSSAAS
jgi:hypothetical protein